jgi:peptide/nickel transport system ATP-binding protein
MVFVSHDLRAVKSISDRVAVMYLGTLCELAPASEIYESPRHPYTALLLDSIPGKLGSGKPTSRAATTELTLPGSAARGCVFSDRCPNARQHCLEQAPAVREISNGHFVACHYPVEGRTS